MNPVPEKTNVAGTCVSPFRFHDRKHPLHLSPHLGNGLVLLFLLGGKLPSPHSLVHDLVPNAPRLRELPVPFSRVALVPIDLFLVPGDKLPQKMRVMYPSLCDLSPPDHPGILVHAYVKLVALALLLPPRGLWIFGLFLVLVMFAKSHVNYSVSLLFVVFSKSLGVYHLSFFEKTVLDGLLINSASLFFINL